MAPRTVIKASDLPESAKDKTIFLTGATGYIGGTVLTYLLSLPAPPAKITALVRDAKKAEALKSISTKGTTIETIVASLSDLEILTSAAESHDIVVSTANADDLDAIKAILEGLKRRKEKTGHRPLLIHTSGTGVLADNAKGQYPNDRIFTDLNPTPATKKSPALLSIATLPETAPHRPVDLAIVIADASAYCKSYIVLPSTIWGPGEGEVFEKGISNSFSQQVPNLVKAALDRGQAGMIGKGANIWNHVNIHDLGELYSLVYAGALRGDIGHGTSGYYFGTTGEYTRYAVASAIGSALIENGWGKDAQPTSFTPEEIQKYFKGSEFDGCNSRGVSDRSKSIGWKPRFTEMADLDKHVKEETVRVEKVFGSKFSKD
ncbi:hypothetical protein BCR39DRAFT_545017 [Naematelia encephala]|uniref:NmrA-like domain-containing protein n=1 Tax=Naematelia encephala TaxID=71784 RepID=A0A1Y2ASB9_9TREE|nr:hypothetical protein BCR39DRAFT_545017 [Naematelia encephala]